ncbi:uncharacterized protein LOC129974967 isoform X2 [Argiope bruennichi]|uniref:uncharacterized protein LOC129974967 isoform X2 n=1 Tax=Argiope bruennichi TaxID=94029 RepID=UPI002494378A|nr:uncharacterized protein LOC129974967 isoform X2 [Argiope bruennichi]
MLAIVQEWISGKWVGRQYFEPAEWMKGTAKIYESRWFAYDAFKFLEDRDLPRKGTTTEMDGLVGAEIDIEEGDRFSEHNMELEATQRELETASPSSPLRPTKRARVEEDNSSSMMKIAFNILKTAEKKLKTEPCQRDEIGSFFDYVKAKVHKYSPEIQMKVQHAIFDILIKADKEVLAWPTLSYQQSFGGPNSSDGGLAISKIVPSHFSEPRQELSQQANPSQSEPSLMCNIKQSPGSSDDSRNFEDFV